MNDDKTATVNTLVFKAVCVIGVINATQMLHLVFSPMARQVGGGYPVYFGVSIILSLACLAGLWLQKRWAALAYVAILGLNQLVLLKMGFWEVTALIMPLGIAAWLFHHRNLLQ
jgi:cation transport ATPase